VVRIKKFVNLKNSFVPFEELTLESGKKVIKYWHDSTIMPLLKRSEVI